MVEETAAATCCKYRAILEAPFGARSLGGCERRRHASPQRGECIRVSGERAYRPCGWTLPYADWPRETASLFEPRTLSGHALAGMRCRDRWPARWSPAFPGSTST